MATLGADKPDMLANRLYELIPLQMEMDSLVRAELD